MNRDRKKLIAAFFQDERGTETLEWALVCGLIVVGAIAAIAMIGPKISEIWDGVNREMPAGGGNG